LKKSPLGNATTQATQTQLARSGEAKRNNARRAMSELGPGYKRRTRTRSEKPSPAKLARPLQACHLRCMEWRTTPPMKRLSGSRGTCQAAGGALSQARFECEEAGVKGAQLSDQERRLFEAVRELVEQIESGNGRDDHGHPLRNLKQLRDARALVDEIEEA
jgi:hypothetical protein